MTDQLNYKLHLLKDTIKKQFFVKLIIIFSLIIICSACTTIKPPLEFAPNSEIIEKALSLQLSQKQTKITHSLQTKPIKIDIETININHIQPLLRDNLAVYHLKGNFDAKLTLQNKEIKQKNKPFDLYLQRQKEGKTWRLISKS